MGKKLWMRGGQGFSICLICDPVLRGEAHTPKCERGHFCVSQIGSEKAQWSEWYGSTDCPRTGGTNMGHSDSDGKADLRPRQP